MREYWSTYSSLAGSKDWMPWVIEEEEVSGKSFINSASTDPLLQAFVLLKAAYDRGLNTWDTVWKITIT